MNKLQFGLISSAAILLSACHDNAAWLGNATPPSHQTLVFDNFTEPSSLDPAVADSTSDSNLVGALFEGLVQLDPLTSRPMAALATHYQVSADGTQYRFYLRGHPHPQGIRLPDSESLPFEYSHGVHAPPDSVPAHWSDGTIITAHDFVYAWRRAADPRTASPLANYLLVIANAQEIIAGKRPPQDLGVSAVDDFTFLVELREPAPYLLSLVVQMAFKAVPRYAVEKARKAGKESLWARPGNIVTSGPFVLTEWRPYDYVRVRRSSTYYQADLVRLEEITFLPINNGAAVVNLYRSGNTQAMEIGTLPEAVTPALLAKRDLRSSALLGVTAYAINLSRPPFNNALLRYALNMSLDKAAIGRFLNAPPARTLVPPGGGYSGPQAVNVNVHGHDYNVLDFDPAAARQLLAAAGYPDGIAPGGKPLAFDLRVQDNPTSLNLAQIVARQWITNLHVNARVSPAEFNIQMAELIAGSYNGIAEDPWIADFADPEAMISPTYIFWASGGWTDPAYLALFSQANRTFDQQERYRKLTRTEARVMHEMPLIPLVYYEAHTLRKPYVHALDPDPLDAHYFRYTWIDTGWKP